MSSCPNEAYNKFISLYKGSFDSCFPIKSKDVKPNNIIRDPWMTPALLTSSRNISKLFLKKLHKPTEVNVSNYKVHLNLFNKLKRKAKVTYYKNILESNKQDTKSKNYVFMLNIQNSRLIRTKTYSQNTHGCNLQQPSTEKMICGETAG